MLKKAILFMAMGLLGCQQKQIHFMVQNSTDTNFDSIIIQGLGNLHFNQLKKRTATFGIMDYSESKTSTDGGYKITLFENENNKVMHFGYYSNGIPTCTSYRIEILKDTIQVEEIAE
ncbi:MAG TPA: hypothetical protein DEU93_08570 [Chitinophagaceae bacterium]|nr:hypothetical protein [Chitinophagaceae bacterium]HML58139.1 hypothetical protein [Ferruginibacter sp.]